MLDAPVSGSVAVTPRQGGCYAAEGWPLRRGRVAVMPLAAPVVGRVGTAHATHYHSTTLAKKDLTGSNSDRNAALESPAVRRVEPAM